jgi:hypothetical protein
MVATHLATRLHARGPSHGLASLTLVSTSCGGFSDGGFSLRNIPPWRGLLFAMRAILSCRQESRISRILELHFAPAYAVKNKNTFLGVYATRAPFDRPILSYLWSLMQNSLAVLTHHVGAAECAALRASGIPILVITGEDDSLVASPHSRHLAECLGATLAISPASGHMVHIEDQAWFESTLLAHFKNAAALASPASHTPSAIANPMSPWTPRAALTPRRGAANPMTHACSRCTTPVARDTLAVAAGTWLVCRGWVGLFVKLCTLLFLSYIAYTLFHQSDAPR